MIHKDLFVRSTVDGKLTPILSASHGIVKDTRDFDWYFTSVPCHAACPAGTDIPGYLDAVRRGLYEEAYTINLRSNVFPAVLGRVCTRPCEPVCRHGRGQLGDTVAICHVKRAAADYKQSPEPVILERIFPATGKRVAVIGAGPAGLTVARDLALCGHEVTIYERSKKPGGMLVQGIPEFRLPRDIVDREISQVIGIGISITCGVTIGEDITLTDLMKNHDVLIVATGAQVPWLPDFGGTDLDGVAHGFDFIRDVNEDNKQPIGKSVIVVGGGFTAVDCARIAQRLGAESIEVVYRQGLEQIRCTPGEIERMDEEGIDLQLHTVPTRFLGDNKVYAAELKLTSYETRQWNKETDTVLIATGQRRSFKTLDENYGPILDEHLVERHSMDHHLPDSVIFTCGDAKSGASSIIEAIGDARTCAREVDRFLMGENRVSDALEISDLYETGRNRDLNEIPRHQEALLDVDARSLSREVDSGLSEDNSIREASRCYLCNIKFEILMDTCIKCSCCLTVMPVEGCIEEYHKTRRDDDQIMYTLSTEPETYDVLIINQDKCIRCNACRESCPVHCISLQKVKPVELEKQDRNSQ